ncbi:hypothetical protein [Spiroplasma taiwanense]|nr:hypothetical protein [Spiroplasma taiwanense]
MKNKSDKFELSIGDSTLKVDNSVSNKTKIDSKSSYNIIDLI